MKVEILGICLTPFPIKWAGKAAKQVYHKLRQKDTGSDATSRTFLQGGRLCLSTTSQSRIRSTRPGCGTQQPLRYRLRLAGRGPNSDSLFPPLAAVVVVAPGRGASGETVHFAGTAKASPTRRGGTPSGVTERLYKGKPAHSQKSPRHDAERAGGFSYKAEGCGNSPPWELVS